MGYNFPDKYSVSSVLFVQLLAWVITKDMSLVFVQP